ncbi:hypothetical protein [Parasitella parasitica]|uniref:Autophagy-related protein 29 n=1 Tax=Parasitella parasitica TaxID=35722 RepID=A0A0B7NSG2_9FUNG|nr:hypothetical protein [Parasitella parasitica]
MELEDKDTFHVVIRLPFKRPQGFIEPPSVVFTFLPCIWTEEMEHKLWQYMSQKNTDWNVIAEQLGVPSSYVVRHAAFIYENQLRGIHQQLRLNTNTSSINRNNAKSPTQTKPRSTSIRYSNTLQYQQQLQQQQQQESLRIESSGSIQRSNTSSRLADITKENSSVKSSVGSGVYKSTSTATATNHVAPCTVGNNSLSSSEESITPPQQEDDEDEDKVEDNSIDEEGKTDDEEFSSHFERMKLQVEEPAFLPQQRKRIITSTSSSSIQNSRQALSMSIQNLKRLHTDKLNDEVPIESSSTASSLHSTKTSSTQPHSPATATFQISTAPGSSNESAMNSIGSSFSDISDSSVTQSALEEAFLSKFNQGSKMSMLSFSRK